MPYIDIPSDKVATALRSLSSRATAKELCDGLADTGYTRRDSQLAIQRAFESGHIVVDDDLDVVSETTTAQLDNIAA